MTGRKSWSHPMTAAYYWAGKGSAHVHRLKGFTFGIDDEAYRHAYDRERLDWLRRDLGTDLVFLSYDWGLPPEIEEDDWRAFERAASYAHETGMRVAAYVQPSNAVSTGSYENRDWYAQTPDGKRIPYYNGRFLTCLNSPEWRQTVLTNVSAALRAGADAIFLDNCFFGAMPVPLARDFTAFAGCACTRCQRAFCDWQTANGLPLSGVPGIFRPARDANSRAYARWRANVLTGFLQEVRALIDSEQPDAALLTNTFGAVNLNTFNIFGVDLPEIARITDMLFVENLQSPRAGDRLLVQNAGTYKLLASLQPGKPALSISYERGIGVDAVPSARSFARTAAEAFAAGGNPVLRACEYNEGGQWTLLKPSEHDCQAEAWKSIVQFVDRNPQYFEDREAASPIAVFVPPGLAWRGDAFPEEGEDYLGVIQALVGAAIPFRVITDLAEASSCRLVLLPEGVDRSRVSGVLVMRYSDLGIEKRRRSLFDLFGTPLEPVIRRAGPRAINAYYTRPLARRAADRLDLLFQLVFRDQFTPLDIDPHILVFLQSLLPVSIRADGPIYADLWKTDEGIQLHLVNYGPRPVRVEVTSCFGEPGEIIAPSAHLPATGKGARSIQLDTYAIVAWVTADLAPPATAREALMQS